MKLNSHAKMETTPQNELNSAPYDHQTCFIVNCNCNCNHIYIQRHNANATEALDRQMCVRGDRPLVS
jgi:hypothetical protein